MRACAISYLNIMRSMHYTGKQTDDRFVMLPRFPSNVRNVSDCYSYC